MRFIFLVLVILIVFIEGVVASGMIQTTSLYPSSVNLCGKYDDNVTLYGSGIFNNQNFTLNNLKATLVIPSGSGVYLLSNPVYNLGTLAGGAYSSLTPTWTVGCDETKPGTYILYINYIADNGFGSSQNEAESHISVNLDNVEAQVTLDKTSPLSAGIVKVTVITSRNLISVPSLTYTYDGKDYFYIPLTGSGREFTGYFIIDDKSEERIGSFKFEGTDIYGKKGDVINQGKIFIVDTKEPSLITSIKSTGAKDYIRLEWHLNDEDIDHYNIYKSHLGGVDYVDFYEETTEEFFEDSVVDEGKTYYYKISAVDEAGNEGKLSSEIKINALVEETENAKLSSELISQVDSFLKNIDDSLNEIDSITDSLSSNQEILDYMGFRDQITKSKSELTSLRSEVSNLKSLDIDSVDLNKRIERFRVKLDSVRASVPESIVLINSVEEKATYSEMDIRNVLNDAFLLTESDLNTEIEKNKEILPSYSINLKASIFSVGYLDGSQKDFSLVVKKIDKGSLNGELSLYEYIPKSLAEDISKVKFVTSKYDIVKEDPIVKWSISDISSEVVYYIEKNTGLDEIKNSRTLFLFNIKNEETNELSGMASSTLSLGKNKLAIIIGLIIISCLTLYYIFFVYNPSFVNKIFGNKIESMIEKCDNHIENKQINLAKEIYISLSNEYKKMKEDEKRKYNKRLVEIYQKICKTT